MKTSADRIHWYSRKVAELGSVHVTKRNESWYRRFYRLFSYKQAMHDRIERERRVENVPI